MVNIFGSFRYQPSLYSEEASVSTKVGAFAISINKAQGQTFARVGVLLQKPAFTHGQLYAASSRVQTLCEKNKTNNKKRSKRHVLLMILLKRPEVVVYTYTPKYELNQLTRKFHAEFESGRLAIDLGLSTMGRCLSQSIELFSYLGGYVGMWLGISLLAIFDLAEILVRFGYFAFKKRQKQRVAEKQEAERWGTRAAWTTHGGKVVPY
ncbi:hypothetical protein LAZ67_22000065 [Cordylochernes scorpioides]|uniref:Uncharacterized protein n=1 Tax=Cordylochernes scorpioides TaxID=51811 RepID=A0ABY6LQE1_9ARAC|nr:hypothetical protein LAZ67_22000065 [Cordylochernes scorpioides]